MKILLLVLLLVAPSSRAFETDAGKAQALARQRNLPLMIEFYGIWCPPCLELSETVFETPAFQEKTNGNFVLLKIDADAKRSWKIKDRYRVGGYPTIIFVSPKGEELYRVVGYRNLTEMLRILDVVRATKNQGLKQACASQSADDLWRCAISNGERKDFAAAEKAYKALETKINPESPYYADTRAYFVEHAANDDLKRDGYERLLKELPQNPRALGWAQDYVSFVEEKGGAVKRDLLEAVLANYPKSSVDPMAMRLGFAPTDLAQLKASLLEKLGKTSEAKLAWKQAADLLLKTGNELAAGTPARGFTIERIGCLEAAGEFDAALALAKEYEIKFPSEFTFHYWVASLNQRAKKYNDALSPARKAFEVSYGDNRIRAANLLVQIYATIPDRAAAEKVAGEVNAQIRPDAALDVRTHKYLAALRVSLAKVPGN